MFSKIPGPSLMKSSKRKKYDHVSYICEDISSSEEDSSNKDNISKEGNTCNKNFGILLDINWSPFREKVRKKHEMKWILFVLIDDRSLVVKGQRHTWSAEETAAIERFFYSHIDDTSASGNKGKLHGKLYMYIN